MNLQKIFRFASFLAGILIAIANGHPELIGLILVLWMGLDHIATILEKEDH